VELKRENQTRGVNPLLGPHQDCTPGVLNTEIQILWMNRKTGGNIISAQGYR